MKTNKKSTELVAKAKLLKAIKKVLKDMKSTDNNINN